MKRNELFWIVALGLPILVMGLWLATLEDKSGATTIRLKIQGYDPRDLLSGHYLQFRVDYGMQPCPGQDGDQRCVCLNKAKPPTLAFATWVGACDDRPKSCPLFIKGTCQYGRLEANIDRFYFDERYADKLQVLPPDGSVEVAVDKEGGTRTLGLFVKEMPLIEWMKTRKP